MSCGRICRREVYVASLGESVRAAAQRMRDQNVGTLIVLDEREKPAGILTDRDIAVRVAADALDVSRTPVLEVMTVVPRCVSESTPIEDALSLMRSAHCRRVPVVGPEGKLVGVLSLDDVLDLLAEEFGTIGGILRSHQPAG